MRTLVKDAQVVFPSGCRTASVLIDGTRIADIDPGAEVSVDTIVAAQGLYLLPGVVDDHVHFREPGLTHKEDFEHATKACAKGGVTTFLDMPNTRPSTTTRALLADKLALAAAESLVNYGFYLGASADNLTELQLAERTPGIKIYVGSSTGDLLVDDQPMLERIFAETQLPIAVHCEDESTIRANRERIGATQDVADHSQIRDHEAARRATQRTLELARRHRHRVHIAHISTAAEIDLLDEYSDIATGEVCPHHLFLNVEDYPRLGTLAQMNPSLKTRRDNERLWQALVDGRLQVVATDHAPHTLEEKRRPYPESPSGVPAIENSLALMLDQVHRGRCSLEQVVSWMCDAPARVWGMVGKGSIEIGNDADLVLVDLERRAVVRNEEQQTKCRWSPWHGVELTGWAVRTWVLGHQVFCEGEFDVSRRGAEVQFDRSSAGYRGHR